MALHVARGFSPVGADPLPFRAVAVTYPAKEYEVIKVQRKEKNCESAFLLMKRCYHGLQTRFYFSCLYPRVAERLFEQ